MPFQQLLLHLFLSLGCGFLGPGWASLNSTGSGLDGMTKAQGTFALSDSLKAKASVIPSLNPPSQ